EDGRVSLKLERLTQANGIDHGNAHDALSDVRATIGLARRLRERQPRLYQFLYEARSKQRVLDQIRLLQPMLHVSGRFSAARHYIAPVLPLAWHPRNRNALIVCDLLADPQPLLTLDAEDLRVRLYTRHDQLAEGELPVPLKLIHVNRCPVLAPLNVLREQDRQRLQLDESLYERHVAELKQAQGLWQDKLAIIYAQEVFAVSTDPEQQLYDGFIGDRDRRLCEQVRRAEPSSLGSQPWPFDDMRLPELLFRYRARNFPDSLSAAEQQRWHEFCRQRLTSSDFGAPNTLAQFYAALDSARASCSAQQEQVLLAWQAHAQQLQARYGLN